MSLAVVAMLAFVTAAMIAAVRGATWAWYVLLAVVCLQIAVQLGGDDDDGPMAA